VLYVRCSQPSVRGQKILPQASSGPMIKTIESRPQNRSKLRRTQDSAATAARLEVGRCRERYWRARLGRSAQSSAIERKQCALTRSGESMCQCPRFSPKVHINVGRRSSRQIYTLVTHIETDPNAMQAQQTTETWLRGTHENHVGSSSSRRGRLKVCSEMLAFESALRATFVYIDISQPPR